MEAAILVSNQDSSINLVRPTDDGGAIEARFVQRTPDTVIVYLSSASGCDRACRFCHLTQTKQTMMAHVTADEYIQQATEVLDLVAKEGKLEGVTTVHFNFMARGDALLNPHFINDPADVILGLANVAYRFNFEPKFKISTIFPQSPIFGSAVTFLKEWTQEVIALHSEVEFYYSLYSLETSFRKRWIPKAMDPEVIGECFADTVGKLRLHHALIKHENAHFNTVARIGQWLHDYNIHSRFNIVRYNPFSSACGQEVDEHEIELHRRSFEKLDNIISAHIITKVGMDVKASCGMFVQ